MLTASDMLLASRAEECSPPESLPHLAQAVSARDIAEERWDCGRAMRFHVYYHGAYGPRLSTALRFHFLVPMGPHMPVRGGNVTSAVDTMASIWVKTNAGHIGSGTGCMFVYGCGLLRAPSTTQQSSCSMPTVPSTTLGVH